MHMDSISRNDVSRLCSLTDAAERIVITAHTRPDGDAIGSCLALAHCLRGAGKEVDIVLPDGCPDSLSFLLDDGWSREHLVSMKDDPAASTELINRCGLLFCLDFNTFSESRCTGLAPLLRNTSCDRILIDHHLNPDLSLFTLAFSETEVSSTAELLYWILLETPWTGGSASRLPAKAAEALMAGMTTDTNNFANSVFPSTLRMASSLLEAGVDRDSLIGSLYNRYEESRIRLLGKLLHEDLRITEDGVAYMIVDKTTLEEYGIREGDTEGFVNVPLSIGKVKMSCFLKEDDGFLRVSLRSKKGVSANRCASEYFNGGGHELASGGRLYIPKDIACVRDAAGYVEKVTHRFMNGERQDGQ